MASEKYYYSNKLKEVLVSRQGRNPNYSLRAFSRDLGMHPATLSMAIQKKRKVPKDNITQVIKNLCLNATEEVLFIDSLNQNEDIIHKIETKPEYNDRFILDESYLKVIAEWEHYAVLTLMENLNFKSSPDYIADRLCIEKERAVEVINNLEQAKLISIDQQGNFNLNQGPVRTPEDRISDALQRAYIENLDISKKYIKETPLELRDFSTITVSTDLEKLPEAKKIIREFRKKMASLLKGDNQTEVFQLAIQLHPLTNIQKEELQ